MSSQEEMMRTMSSPVRKNAADVGAKDPPPPPQKMGKGPPRRRPATRPRGIGEDPLPNISEEASGDGIRNEMPPSPFAEGLAYETRSRRMRQQQHPKRHKGDVTWGGFTPPTNGADGGSGPPEASARLPLADSKAGVTEGPCLRDPLTSIDKNI